MISREDRVLTLLTEANPVIDVDSFVNDPTIRASVQRAESHTPDQHHARIQVARRLTRRRRRGWFAAVAAAAAVFLVIGVGGWLNLALNDEIAPGGPNGGVPTSVFDGTTCRYAGPTEFPVGSEVTFTFINESDVKDMFYVIWKMPDGTTAHQIYETGLRVPGTNQGRDALASSDFPASSDEVQLTATLDRAGLYALACVETAPDGHDHASLVTATTN